MAKLESKFQAELIKELKEIFKECIVLKLDSGYLQGIPDLLILYKNKRKIEIIVKNTMGRK